MKRETVHTINFVKNIRFRTENPTIQRFFENATIQPKNKNTNILNYLQVLANLAYLWLNTNHLRNLRSDSLSQDKSCKEIIYQ